MKFNSKKDRVSTGSFYTPKIWALEAHKEIELLLGPNWKTEYVVWDCCCGEGNLTKDIEISNLYLSTLEQADIDHINTAGYNPGSIKFQYNFLSESLIDGVPLGLKDAIYKKRKILFLINPPYGRSGSNVMGQINKKDVDTVISKDMKLYNLGSTTNQLYAQFIYKICKLQEINNNIVLAIFCPPSFQVNSYSKFKNFLTKRFGFSNGFIMRSNNFNDVSDGCIGFTVWSNIVNNNEIKLNIKTIDDSKKIVSIGNKKLYHVSKDLSPSKWAKSDNKTNVIFKFYKDASCIGYNGQFVQLFNTNSKIGTIVTPNNFNNAISLFAARRIIKPTWINSINEYMIPNVNHPNYQQWNNDCIIMALFDSQAKQSSSRLSDPPILNQSFFMSQEEMLKLANEHRFNEMYNDAKHYHSNRFVYNFLKITNLSKDCKDLIRKAKNLIRLSMDIREAYSNMYPELQLQCWDASWFQLRPFLKSNYIEEYKDFLLDYKKIVTRMIPWVYEFKFLEKEILYE